MLMLRHRLLFAMLIVSTIGTAVTEGLGISMLVPLLSAINQQASPFGNVPLLGQFAHLLADWPVAAKLEMIAALLVLVALARGVMGYGMLAAAQLFAVRIETEAKRRTVERALALDFETVQRLGTPTLASYVNEFAYQAGQFALMNALIASNFAMLCLYVAVCLDMSWRLTLFAGVMLWAAVSFVKQPLSRRLHAASIERNDAIVSLSNLALGAFSGLKLLRLFVAERGRFETIDAALGQFNRGAKRMAELNALSDPVFQTLVTLIIAALLVTSAVIMGENAATKIPLIILFLFVLSRVAAPVQTINRARLSIAGYVEGTGLLLEFLDGDRFRAESREGRPYPGLQHRLSFEHVSFRYQASDSAALDDVSFEIPARRMTAIVGPSGAGKSTVINLLGRLYEPQAGCIAADGVVLSEYAAPSWRTRLSVVTQDTFLFDATIADNLRIARPDASDAELEAVARRAHAHDFITAMPQGYATTVGERGLRLSGGQQQRLALARALLAHHEILVLDEATSNLDAETEHLVEETLDALAGECTLVVVAHRLATVERADRIVVMDKGRVAETGDHASLMRARGLYHRMVALQMFTAEPRAAAAAEG